MVVVYFGEFFCADIVHFVVVFCDIISYLVLYVCHAQLQYPKKRLVHNICIGGHLEVWNVNFVSRTDLLIVVVIWNIIHL